MFTYVKHTFFLITTMSIILFMQCLHLIHSYHACMPSVEAELDV